MCFNRVFHHSHFCISAKCNCSIFLSSIYLNHCSHFSSPIFVLPPWLCALSSLQLSGFCGGLKFSQNHHIICTIIPDNKNTYKYIFSLTKEDKLTLPACVILIFFLFILLIPLKFVSLSIVIHALSLFSI